MSPLALLMALRGRSTLRTLRIFTTEMALELQRHTHTFTHLSLFKYTYIKTVSVLKYSPNTYSKPCMRQRLKQTGKSECMLFGYWLQEEGDQWDADDQEIQQVKPVPAERALMEERSVDRHLWMREHVSNTRQSIEGEEGLGELFHWAEGNIYL